MSCSQITVPTKATSFKSLSKSFLYNSALTPRLTQLQARPIRHCPSLLLCADEIEVRVPCAGRTECNSSDMQYEMYIAIKFLEKIRDEFFNKYDAKKRNTANAHSLKNFKPTLESWMLKYNNKEEVDKFYMLKKELREVEEQALINMNLTIIRGQNIEILVHKSQDLANISYTLKETSTKVKNTMWWKSKKLLLGICTVVVAVVLVVVLVVLL